MSVLHHPRKLGSTLGRVMLALLLCLPLLAMQHARNRQLQAGPPQPDGITRVQALSSTTDPLDANHAYYHKLVVQECFLLLLWLATPLTLFFLWLVSWLDVPRPIAPSWNSEGLHSPLT